MDSPYQYIRLDLATDAVRLVKLLKGDQSHPIECEIFETYLHQVDGVPYEALSYVWGTEQSADRIWLEGHQFEVTENLYDALIHLRRSDEDRILWIDAICIDQGHDAERGHQVGQMRLVYRYAQRVVIWLGSSSSDIDALFDQMDQLDRQVLTMPRPHTILNWKYQWTWVDWPPRRQYETEDIRDAMESMLRHEWFSRIWVLQEAALAKSAAITCGRNEVNSRTFVVMPELLDIKCIASVQARLDILPGTLREQSWWDDQYSNELLTLLQKFGGSQAKDPRDVIYALLGLSTHAFKSEVLRPNYDITLQEAIQHTIAYLLTRTQDLPDESPVSGLPEWSMEHFLNSLEELPYFVFQWATIHAQDALLADLLIAQTQKKDIQRTQHYGRISRYMSCTGDHGPPITIAMKKQNKSLVELLLTFPTVDIYTTDSDGNSPASIAAETRNTTVLEFISRKESSTEKSLVSDTKVVLKEIPIGDTAAIPEQIPVGDTRLLAATKRGDEAAVRSILFHSKVDLSLLDSNGDGALNIAVRRGDENLVRTLLAEATDEHRQIRGSDGLTPFETALTCGYKGIIEMLLHYHWVELHDFVKTNHLDFVRKILDLAPQLAENCWVEYHTPLGAAAEAGKTHAASILLDRGADIDFTSFDDRRATPLWIAASHGDLDTVRLLVERGADIELTANDTHAKNTPLWAAASRGHVAVAIYLLESGANFEVASDDPSLPALKDVAGSLTVLWAAIYANQTEAIRTLSEGGVDLEMPGPWISDQLKQWGVAEGEAWAKPIWIAASLGHTDIVRLCIQQGVNIEARDSFYGMTPFWRAAHQNQPEVMRVLIAGGADIRARPVW